LAPALRDSAVAAAAAAASGPVLTALVGGVDDACCGFAAAAVEAYEAVGVNALVVASIAVDFGVTTAEFFCPQAAGAGATAATGAAATAGGAGAAPFDAGTAAAE
jgi:hypothetical protein